MPINCKAFPASADREHPKTPRDRNEAWEKVSRNSMRPERLLISPPPLPHFAVGIPVTVLFALDDTIDTH